MPAADPGASLQLTGQAGFCHPTGRGERGHAHRPAAGTVLATGITRNTRLAYPRRRIAALVAGVVESAPATTAASLMNSVAAGNGLHLYSPN